MSEKEKAVECSDTCPNCKRTMQKTNKRNKKHLFYYCKHCKQKYRIEAVQFSQKVKCPHCNKKFLVGKKTIEKLWGNIFFNFNFYIRKVKVNE